MGFVLGASMIANACLDLAIGFYYSRFVRDQQAAGLWQFFGAILAAVAFVAFCCAGLVPDKYQLIYALSTVFLFRFGYSSYDVPQNAYMAFATHNDQARSQFAATRYIAAGAALVSLTLVFGPLIRNLEPDQQGYLFALLALLLAVVSVVCSATLMVFTRKYCPKHPLNKTVAKKVEAGVGLFAGESMGLYCLLLVSIFTLSFVSTAFSKLEAYFTAYGIESMLIAAYFMTSVALGKVLFQPFWMFTGSRFGLVTNLQLAALSLASACLMFYLLAGVGGGITLLAGFLYGAAWGGVAMSLWGLLASASSSDPSQTTKRYGAFTFCSKIGKSICVFALGYLLASFDYKEASDGADKLIAIMSITPMLGATLLFLLASGLIFNNKKKPSLSRAN